MKSWLNWTTLLPPLTRIQLPEGAAKDPIPDRAGSLRFRLLLTVTIALLPIAVVSILQGMERARIDVDTVREQLMQSARAAASKEENMLASGEQILRAFSNIDDVQNVTADCDRAMFDALIGVRYFINLSRMNAQGTVVCSALPQAKGLNVNALPLFQDARRKGAFVVSGRMVSRVTHRPIISGMLPLHDKAAHFTGAVAFSMDVAWLDDMVKKNNLPPGAVVSVFDRSGTIIAANNPAVARTVFAQASRQVAQTDGAESAADNAGDKWNYAIAALDGNNLFVGFAMRQSQLFGPTYLHVGTDFLLPIAMIGLAWTAIWFATERQVTQWIIYLRRVSAAYRTGHYGLRPSLEDAPIEFRLLGNAMSEMAEGIQDRDRRLREAVAQKSLLIKEIHHRVKNNLQIVMSLLSLQSAQLKDPAARETLNQSQMRINALALVHRILHEIEDQSTVDVDRLLQELTQQIVEGMAGGGSRIAIKLNVLPRSVPGELAVPLSLFTVEALTNIFKHAFPAAHGPGTIHLTLTETDGNKLLLAIEDDGIGYIADDASRSMGSRLIRTFGQQLRGTTSVRSKPGKGTTVELVFPDPGPRGTLDGDGRARG